MGHARIQRRKVVWGFCIITSIEVFDSSALTQFVSRAMLSTRHSSSSWTLGGHRAYFDSGQISTLLSFVNREYYLWSESPSEGNTDSTSDTIQQLHIFGVASRAPCLEELTKVCFSILSIACMSTHIYLTSIFMLYSSVFINLWVLQSRCLC